MRRVEFTRYLPHRDVGEAEIILHPCMGGYRIVARNGPTDLSTKMANNGPTWRILDDELEQLHRRIGQAPSDFDEEDSEVIRVRGEVPEDGPIPSLLVRGPDLLDPSKRRQQLGG
jgi:hypothetical protein